MYSGIIVSILLVTLWILPARADVAISPVSLAVASAIFIVPLLLLVTFTEAVVLWFLLARQTQYSFLAVLKQILLINLATTMVGGFLQLFVLPYLSLDIEISFLLQFILTLLIELPLLEKYYSKSFTQYSRSQVFRAGFVMNFVTYAFLFTMLYASYEDRTDYRNPYFRVKHSMQTLQTIAETYGVDWGGIYAPTLEILEQEAREKGYWKNSLTPEIKGFFRKVKTDRSLLLMSNEQPRPVSLSYSAITMPDSDEVFQYLIRGYGRSGKLIQKRAKPYTLSNEPGDAYIKNPEGVFQKYVPKKWLLTPPYTIENLDLTGTLLAVNSLYFVVENDQKIQIWQRHPKTLIKSLNKESRYDEVFHLSSQARWLLITRENAPLSIWDVQQDKEYMSFKNLTSVEALITLDEKQIVMSSSDRGVEVWDIEHDTPLYYWDLNGKNRLAVHKDKLAFGGSEQPLEVWDITTPKEPRAFFKSKQKNIVALTFSKKGHYIAVAYQNGQVDVRHGNGNLLRTFEGKSDIQQLAFVNKDKTLVAMYELPDPRTFSRWSLK